LTEAVQEDNDALSQHKAHWLARMRRRQEEHSSSKYLFILVLSALSNSRAFFCETDHC